MSIPEYLSLSLVVLTIILGYASYRQSKKNNVLQEKIAHLQGIYNHPQLELLIFNKPIVSNYVYAFPFKKDGAFIAPLNLFISNKGNFRANNLELFLNFSNEIIPHEIMKLEITSNSFKDAQFKVLNKTKYKTTLGFQADYLEKENGISIKFELPLKAPTINVIKDTIITTPNKVQSKLKYKFSYSYVINIWAYSENHSPISKEVKISVVDTSEITLKDYYKNIAIENEKNHNENIKKLSRLQKIYYYLHSNHQLRPKTTDLCYITSEDFTRSKTVPNLNNLRSVEIGYGVESTDGFIFINPLKLNGYPKQL